MKYAMSTLNVYLDIDGVMLPTHLYWANRQEALYARHLHEFLAYVTSRFTTYWLTAHCRGDAQATVRHLSGSLPAETLELARRILPTNWDTRKTDAIHFGRPFVWFDDRISGEDKVVLMQHGALASWVKIDLAANPDQLGLFVKQFPNRLSEAPGILGPADGSKPRDVL